jgi:hypothetical protein
MAGSTGDSGNKKPDGFTTQLFIVIAAVYTGVGNIIANDLQHRQPLMFALLGGLVVALSGLYVLRQRRSRRIAPAVKPNATLGRELPGQSRILSPTAGGAGPADQAAPAAPAAPARGWVIALMCALLTVAFAVGYWTIGNGFAHSDALGWVTAAGVLACAAIAMVAAWFFRLPRWAAWLLPSSRMAMAMACAVAALGLSAGGTLGSLDLVPACPVPTELRVLSSEEALPGVLNAITVFEQREQSILQQGCYAVDLTAFAAPSDAAAEADLESGWDPGALSASGPRPDIWIPASSSETGPVSATLAISGTPAPQLDIAGSVASSRLVIAVPTALLGGVLFGTASSGTLGAIYGLLADDGVSLEVPGPRESATALLGVTKLYDDIEPGTERKIEASGDFPPDSGTLLCAAAQAAQQAQATGQPPPRTAYLVSDAAVMLNNTGQLTEGACPALAKPPTALTPLNPLTQLYPSDAPSLDFPFVTVNWGGDPATQRERQGYKQAFYHWLTTPDGQSALKVGKLDGPLHDPAQLPAPDQVSRALARFTAAQTPARILVAIDDSLPMESYLPQVEAATAAALGPGSSPRSPSSTDSGALGARDSFGVWAYPGQGDATHAELIPLSRATTGRLASVAPKVSGLPAHDHSAQFDLLTEAARLLYGQQPGGLAATNSVVLLTDGDSRAEDPGSSNFVTVTRTALRPPSLPAQSRIKVFVIAFGPVGCAQTPPGRGREQSLEALATSTGGTCVNASGDLTRQLSLLISQVAGG